MSKQDINLTAYCGLYCGDCIRYKSKATDLARNLRDELQRTEFAKYAEVKSSSLNAEKQLKQYGEFLGVLDAIIKLQCKEPCRVIGGCPTFSCRIVDCCKKKRFEGCWQCVEFEDCNEFESLKPFHSDTPKKNLRKIKELGLEGWAKHRNKFYIWQ
ncbi:MAG: DUF3795 domain-containing protein [Chloroflexota bacterium]